MSLNCFKIDKIDYAKLNDKKVSVVLPTFRKNPKFELLYNCMVNQTVKPYEIVISDYLYNEHHDFIKMISDKYNISTTHISRNNLGNADGMNNAIVNSRGDYICCINDCSYYPHKFIEKHLLVSKHNFLSLGSRYFSYSTNFPIEKYLTGTIEIPNPQDEVVSKKIEELSHGIKDYLRINFNEYNVISPQDFRLIGLPQEFLTSDNIIFEALPGWSYGGNIMAPIEMVLDINGYNEEYDKGYGWADCDFGVRLFNKGYKLFINPSNWCLEIQDKDHESIYNLLPEQNSKRSADYNWRLYEHMCEKRISYVNPHKNLKELREKLMK